MKLLIVDDDEVTRKLLQEVFSDGAFEIALEASAESALKRLSKEKFALVLSDIRMLELSGLELLTKIKEVSPKTVVILMTAFGSMEGAIEAIQRGAFDYISKPFKIVELKALVDRAVKHWHAISEDLGAAKSTNAALAKKPKTLLGKSPQILEVYKSIARASMSVSSVLLIGESGTGKELVARAVHDNSSRKSRKFVAVNCGAITETLLESELFGHVKGAFTGAGSDKRGLIEEAHQGTLFLDEIGDIPISLQVKLLRVLQEGEFKPVGSNETRKVDFRLIAATHRNLDQMVQDGEFREDLYYRLKVIQIHLPALRDRLEDLDELVTAFLDFYSEKNRKSVSHVSGEAMKILRRHSWPGNIRELEHAIERAVAMTGGNVLEAEDFPDLGSTTHKSERIIDENTDGRSLDEMEKTHILKVLEQVKYNRSKAAEVLGIDRATLYRKAQKYGITLSEK